jgi:phytoene/squalene synthetase
VTGLLIPANVRGAYFAVRAFNVEVSTIVEQVRQNPSQAGHMRFQFWKDALSQINNGSLTLKHPVAEALAYYVRKDDLTVRWLERCLEARYFRILPALFIKRSIQPVHAYLEQILMEIACINCANLQCYGKKMYHIGRH